MQLTGTVGVRYSEGNDPAPHRESEKSSAKTNQTQAGRPGNHAG